MNRSSRFYLPGWECLASGRFGFGITKLLMLGTLGVVLMGCQPAEKSQGDEAEFNRVKAEAKKEAQERLAKLGLSRSNFVFREDEYRDKNSSDSFKPARRRTEEELRELSAGRLKWNQATLRAVYEAKGERDPKWDADVIQILDDFAASRSRSLAENGRGLEERMKKASGRAYEAGCRDAMLEYLYVRFHSGEGELTNAFVILGAKRRIAESMVKGPYPAIRKFYATLRAAEQMGQYLTRMPSNQVASERNLRGMYQDAVKWLVASFEDGEMPDMEAGEAAIQLLSGSTGGIYLRDRLYDGIREGLNQRYSKSGVAQWVKGEFYTDFAWDARGTGFADSVTAEGWKLFERRIQVASEALNESWEIDPSRLEVALRMFTVELGQGVGRARMERWYRNALVLQPNSYDACYKKLYYLEPKWHGSEEAMIQFGRECVESEEMGGLTPYVLVRAHERAAYYAEQSGIKDYWRKKGVWEDVQAAMEKLFRINPESEVQGYHHNYALMAHRCGKWEVWQRELGRFPQTNHAYFGGEGKFREMVEEAGRRLGAKR